MVSGARQPEDPSLLATRLTIHPSAFVAPNAVLVGRVSLAERASVWYGCVLRGDLEPVCIGAETNVQDLTVVHVDRGMPVVIGERVTVGHRCVIHGCRIEDDVLIGMGAVLLSGCRIGRGALVAAGAVVPEDCDVPENTVAAGVPASIRGPVSERLRARIREGATSYVRCAEGYRRGELGGGSHGGGVTEPGR